MGAAATEHLSEPPTKSSHVPNVVGLAMSAGPAPWRNHDSTAVELRLTDLCW
jgi:hypothetical protein